MSGVAELVTVAAGLASAGPAFRSTERAMGVIAAILVLGLLAAGWLWTENV